ncbi:hypothetical protein [Neobacillus cucumis]|uniref:Uncharacterized protein n=1 Tax=Neobacillus cucumis TaxID=1740721 RepID=A0A2N5HQK9_9BACI|nr:hypothetical protein [Neobacillus cucumis]PLS07825.1 hypothetical protein CVD27_05095 [Neobacillus cucumis]
MKAIISFSLVLVVVCTLMIPTSTYASTNTTQSNNSSGFFQTFSLSYLLTIFNNDNPKVDYQNNYSDTNSYDYPSKDWWDSFLKWCNGGSYDGGGNTGECKDSKYSWSNDDGCLDSAEIWKRWYCK